MTDHWSHHPIITCHNTQTYNTKCTVHELFRASLLCWLLSYISLHTFQKLLLFENLDSKIVSQALQSPVPVKCHNHNPIYIKIHFYLSHLCCWCSHVVLLCFRNGNIWNVSQVTIAPQLHWSCSHLAHHSVCITISGPGWQQKQGKTCKVYTEFSQLLPTLSRPPVTGCAVEESLN